MDNQIVTATLAYGNSGHPLLTAFIGLGSGALFLLLLLGLLIVTGYLGFARRFFGLPSDSSSKREEGRASGSPPWSPDIMMLDGSGGHEHVDRRHLDQIIAVAFIALGGLALISGLIELAITLSR